MKITITKKEAIEAWIECNPKLEHYPVEIEEKQAGYPYDLLGNQATAELTPAPGRGNILEQNPNFKYLNSNGTLKL